MVTSWSFMKWLAVAAGLSGVKGKPAYGRSSKTTLDTGKTSGCGGGMNGQEVTMSYATPKRNGLVAHAVALEGAAAALRLVRTVPAPLKSLADQVVRAAVSVPANLSEGQGRAGRDRVHHWRIAYASALEVGTHLELLSRAGAVDTVAAAKALELFDRARALTWRLLHPRR